MTSVIVVSCICAMLRAVSKPCQCSILGEYLYPRASRMVYTTMIYGTPNRYWTGRRRSHQQGTLRSQHGSSTTLRTQSLPCPLARFGDHRWLGTSRGHKEATFERAAHSVQRQVHQLLDAAFRAQSEVIAHRPFKG